MATFSIRKVHSRVAIVSFHSCPDEFEWKAYETCYKEMFDTMHHFILIFDTRNLGLPSIFIVQQKAKLLLSLKHRTLSQVMGVMVLTEYDFIKDLVLMIIKAGGQAAPFAIVTSVAECVQQTLDWVRILHFKRVPERPGSALSLLSQKPVSWRQAGHASSAGIIVWRFMMFMRHFVRFYVKCKNERLNL